MNDDPEDLVYLASMLFSEVESGEVDIGVAAEEFRNAISDGISLERRLEIHREMLNLKITTERKRVA